LAVTRSAIPYLDDGKTVGRKHRTLSGEKRFMQDKGLGANLLERGLPARRIVEGPAVDYYRGRAGRHLGHAGRVFRAW
jgi:hypothetical protein